MTKTESAIARIQIVEAAQIEIARQKGKIARAYNRPNTGVLVPKTESQAEHDAWMEGHEEANKELSGE